MFTNIQKQYYLLLYLPKLAYFLRKIQTLRVNNLRILKIKNAKLSDYHFYMNLNLRGDFQICISISLNSSFQKLGTSSKILFCNLKPRNSVRSSGLITKQLVLMRFFPRYLISFSFQNWKLINKSVTQLKAFTLKHSTPKLLQL